MSSTCDCTSVYKNSGQPTCKGTNLGIPRKAIMVPKYKSDGTLNKITLPATLNQSYFEELVNHTDRTQRWYPLPQFVNAEIAKAESVYETYNDGSKQLVHEGVRSFTAKFPNMQPQYLSVLKSGKCNEMAVYFVDNKGSLQGLSNGTTTELYPFDLNANTFNAILHWATDTTVTSVDFSFEFATDMLDENIRIVTSGSMVNVNLLQLEGLYDATKVQVSTGQTSMVFKLSALSLEQGNPVAITGLGSDDFALYNVTTSTAVTIITCVESTTVKGQYTLTYASQTIGNVIRITPTKAKIDFADVVLATAIVA